MSFKLHKSAPAYFRHLLSGGGAAHRFDTQFDAYYYCLLVGLDRRQLRPLDELGDEFVRDYVLEYQPHAATIAGLLVDAELDRTNTGREDVKAVEKRMVELLEAGSASRLSKEGQELLNRYAAGGFTVLNDLLANPPQSLEEFFVSYHQLWTREESVPPAPSPATPE